MEKESTRLTLSGLAAVIDERDKRYDVMFLGLKESLVVAVAAVNKQTESAFRAAQTAIDKAELSQKVYNEDHNSLTKRMVLIDRYESDQKTLSEKIDELKVAVNDIQVKIGVGAGKEQSQMRMEAHSQWGTSELIVVGILVINVALTLILHFAK